MADVDRLEGTASHLNRTSLLKSLEFELQEIERHSGELDCRRHLHPHDRFQLLILEQHKPKLGSFWWLFSFGATGCSMTKNRPLVERA
jgi:hypothetical protein